MKTKLIKLVLLLVPGCVALLQSHAAYAHNQGGSFSTGLASAVDYYQVTCSNDGSGPPRSLQVLVADVTANTAGSAL